MEQSDGIGGGGRAKWVNQQPYASKNISKLSAIQNRSMTQ